MAIDASLDLNYLIGIINEGDYLTLLHILTKYISCGSNGFREGDFSKYSLRAFSSNFGKIRLGRIGKK